MNAVDVGLLVRERRRARHRAPAAPSATERPRPAMTPSGSAASDLGARRGEPHGADTIRAAFDAVRAVAIVNGNARRARGRAAREARARAAGRRAVHRARSTTRARSIRAEIARGVRPHGARRRRRHGRDGADADRGGVPRRRQARAGDRRCCGSARGNAIADTLGASDDAADGSRAARARRRRVAGAADARVLGVRAPFVGVGRRRAAARGSRRRSGASSIACRVRAACSAAARATRCRSRCARCRGSRRRAADARPSRTSARPRSRWPRPVPTGARSHAGGELWTGACTLVAGATIPLLRLRPEDVRVRAHARRSVSAALWRCRARRDHAEYAGGISRRVLLGSRARLPVRPRRRSQLDREDGDRGRRRVARADTRGSSSRSRSP